MGLVGNFWSWISSADNQRTLGFIMTGVAAATAAGWALYKHFSKSQQHDEYQSVSRSYTGEFIMLPITTERLNTWDSAEAVLDKARKAMAKGDMKTAELLYQQILDISKDHAAEAAYQLSCVAKIRIDYKQADHYCTKAIQLRPENLLYLNAAGEIKQIIGQYKEAEDLFKRVLKKSETT